MISSRLQKEINIQINEELFSAYLYLSMSAYCGRNNLMGMASWFYVQFLEENDHAMGFFNYLIERGGNVILEKIGKPSSDFDGPKDLFNKAFKHEKHITERINLLYELGKSEKDYAFLSFIRWYIDEQVEEEANADQIIQTLELIGEKGSALYLFDKELGGRVYKKASILD